MRVIISLILIFVLAGLSAFAEQPPGETSPATSTNLDPLPISLEQLSKRLQRLEEQNSRLEQQNAKLADQNASLSQQLNKVEKDFNQLKGRVPESDGATNPPAAELPEAAATELENAQTDEMIPSPPPAEPSTTSRRFLVGDYDFNRGAFVLVRPNDVQRTPFELRLDVFTQARYTNFARSTGSWVDSSGERLPVSSFQLFEVTRNFVQFSGFALDPKLQYTVSIFSSTGFNDTVYMGWMGYRFSKAFDLRVGNGQVPGTREWLTSFRYTMGTDRLMATTFFRPNISPGIWAVGEPIDNLHYMVMVADSWNRFRQAARLGQGITFGGTLRWEPRGPFGVGSSDVEGHEQFTPRLGTNLAITKEHNQAVDVNGVLSNPEDVILRLSDGTPLFRTGALGRDVTLKTAQVQLWTLDAAFKYRGLGVSGEYFLRWLDGFQAISGQVPIKGTFDHGAMLEAGYFAVPHKLEGFARTSFVTGPFGGGYEWGGGLNWYVLGSRDWRMTAEVLFINHSPANNILTGYRAGESGSLFQVQWFSDF